MLVTTKHRDAIVVNLIDLGLLRQEKPRQGCQARLPLKRGHKLFAGNSLQSCTGACPESCEPHTLSMHDTGKLVLYQGSERGPVIWKAAMRGWWQKPVATAEYWAMLSDVDLRIGKGDVVLWKRRLAKCGRLLEHLPTNLSGRHAIGALPFQLG